MTSINKDFSTGFANRMFASVVGIFLLLAIMFLVFQYQRETEYKVDILHNRLQVINYQAEALWPDTMRTLPENTRLTVISADGTVLYDNVHRVDSMANHLNRKEVAQALRDGDGYDIQRNSMTLGDKFFYSATYFKEKNIVVRSALPYNGQLYKDLTIDKTFAFFILGITVVLCIVLFQIARRLALSEREKVEGEKQQLKRQLTQNAAHELKTPTASISAYLETLLADDSTLTDEQRRHFLERSYAQCQRMTNILSDMSALARMDSVQQLKEQKRIRLKDLVQTILDEVNIALRDADMTVNLNVSDITVYGDQSLIYSIFRNLIDNSIAYAGPSTSINVYAANMANGMVEIYVSDNGVGVPSQHLPHLCERFYRIDKGRSRKLGGTGLGLAIVRNAVLLHGGEIDMLPTPPHGLTVRFTLPAV